ncbi:MAG: DNA polymerase IV, partial [Prolixibacteraceae bacterium]|nr:DNA polymerase IV [Prolixibacteraceae bacterium]
LNRCPGLILVEPNGKAYKEASNIIRSIFHEYTDYVEPLSLDEAFLDVTFPKTDRGSATLLAMEIKSRIFESTGLTASAGVSYNKFLAKVASDFKKPDGLFVITPQEALAFLEELKIERFFGVGDVAARKFHESGIYSGKDLKKISKTDLVKWFGKSGAYYYNIVRGVDNREVENYREAKSIGAEQTFETDLSGEEELKKRLDQIIERVWKRIEKSGASGKTLTLKVKYHDFEIISRSKTYNYYIHNKEDMRKETFYLFENEVPFKKPVRLLGVTLSNFFEEGQQPVQASLKF